MRSIRERVARCGDGTPDCGTFASIDLDIEGLRVRDAWRDAGPARIRAAEILAHPGPDGFVVHVLDLDVHRRPTEDRDASPEATPDAAERRPPASPRIDTGGVPVTVTTTGRVRWAAGPAKVELLDPSLRVDASGVPTIAGRASASASALGETLGIEATLAAATPREHWRAWSVDGEVSVDGGPALPATGTLSRDAVGITLRDPSGHTLRVDADPARRQIVARGDGFALANLGPALQRLAARLGVQTEVAEVGGELEVDLSDGVRVSLADAWVSGLVVEHEALSRAAVRPHTLGASGDVHVSPAGDVHGSLWLSHRDLSGHVELAGAGDRVSLRAELPRTPCQQLVDGLPIGFADVLRGARLQGELAGVFELELSRRDLAQTRALDPTPIPLAQPPGTMRIEWPFLQQCQVDADPPAVDFAGLRGPYRHRFVDGSGRGRARVMAPGGEGYTPLPSVRMVAAAFIALEDSRFYKHDGFDREQMEVALWHNIVVGRVSRGASTISQQTARNLWLGIDRSLGRKVAEAFLTSRLEQEVDKARILELYVNVVELGPGVHGVKEAARFHFDRPASSLTAAQAVHLAMLAPAPAVYSERFAAGEVDDAWRAEIRRHLRRMRAFGFISAQQLRSSLYGPLGLVDRTVHRTEEERERSG